MNFKYLLSCIEELQNALQGNITLGAYQFSGLKIRVTWFYKDRLLDWQYVVSRSEMELINDNSAFVLFLIEKARNEYSKKKLEIDEQ